MRPIRAPCTAVWSLRRARVILLLGSLLGLLLPASDTASRNAIAQDAAPMGALPPAAAPVSAPEPDGDGDESIAGPVDVRRVTEDVQIERRLTEILVSTEWYVGPRVEVRDGVVFLYGGTRSERRREWAADLARRTTDVVAVVNRIEVSAADMWDFTPAWRELQDLGRVFVNNLPVLLVAIVVLVLAWLGSIGARNLLRTILPGQIQSPLLREVTVQTVGFLVFLGGLYLVLRVAGLTQLALTVLGGTGLIGLVLGIAFRDITENFLASIFLSLQHPFREGDIVEIEGVTGMVKQLTSRTTVLITPDGNQVQIPNATVFKSVIRNFTSNPNRRDDFVIGIGYDDSIAESQRIALEVLAAHPGVLQDPESWVLVDNLGPATVNLRVYYWIDGSQHSLVKVRSAVIRLIKKAFQDAGISLPDEAREMVFPQGVQVRLTSDTPNAAESSTLAPPRPTPPLEAPATVPRKPRRESKPETADPIAPGERTLASDKEQIEEQARRSWSPEQGENLL